MGYLHLKGVTAEVRTHLQMPATDFFLALPIRILFSASLLPR